MSIIRYYILRFYPSVSKADSSPFQGSLWQKKKFCITPEAPLKGELSEGLRGHNSRKSGY